MSSLKCLLITLVLLALTIESYQLRIPISKANYTCAGHCSQASDPSLPCQCNAACSNFNDCCDDYQFYCASCSGRCDDPLDSNFGCQCNKACSQYHDCCPDYDSFCGSGGGVTDNDLRTLSEELLTVDVNNGGTSIVLNYQGKTTSGNTNDKAPEPLFSRVDSTVFEKSTFSLMIDLLDNYVPDVKIEEDHNSQEVKEENMFLDAMLATEVMQKTKAFLSQKGFIHSDSEFENKLIEMWFEPYDRDGTNNNVLGSSGFEHVFVGESKNGAVGGFHGWVSYYLKEREGQINYLGYIDKADFSGKGEGISLVFQWNGEMKAYGSMPVGTSPELEMAMYTVCFITRPESKCTMALSGAPVLIQTYPLKANGKTHVGTAYCDWH